MKSSTPYILINHFDFLNVIINYHDNSLTENNVKVAFCTYEIDFDLLIYV